MSGNSLTWSAMYALAKMRTLRLRSHLVVAALGLAVSAESAAIGLREIFTLALQHDATYLAATADNRAAQEFVPQAKARLLPTLSADASVNGTDPDTQGFPPQFPVPFVFNWEDQTVIALGDNLFYGTGIPACIIVCRHNKPEQLERHVYFIDASDQFESLRNQNELTDDQAAAIAGWYHPMLDRPGRSRMRRVA